MQNKFFSIEDNKIIAHNAENYQFRLENLYFDEGYMITVISVKNEDFNSKM